MSNKKCRQAIEARLYSWAAARTPPLRVAFQNVEFTPTGPAELYLRGFLLPADTASQTLEGTHRAYRGLYQINISAPLGAGPGAAEGVLDELAALFPNNQLISVTGLTVQVTSPVSAGPALQEADRYILPASFQYRADTT